MDGARNHGRGSQAARQTEIQPSALRHSAAIEGVEGRELSDTDEKITSKVARLKLVIREAWEAWEKSKEDYHEKTSTQQGQPVVDEQGKQISIETVKAIMYDAEKRGFGEPRYLDIIIKAETQICKLLGLDKVVLDLNAGFQGGIEVRYINSGHQCASSEQEVIEREGLDRE